jgi:hypothetical protein
MSSRSKLTPKRIKIFLEELARTGNVAVAASAVGTSRVALYNRKGKDPEFSAAWDESVEIATDLLLEEARRRAYDGVTEPVFFQGKECGYIKKYSDVLLMFLIKGRRPEYATERRELSGRDGSSLTPPTINVNFIKADANDGN